MGRVQKHGSAWGGGGGNRMKLGRRVGQGLQYILGEGGVAVVGNVQYGISRLTIIEGERERVPHSQNSPISFCKWSLE